MSHELYFGLSVVVLAALLYLPVRKLIWVLSVRRLERKLEQALSEEERRMQLNRASFLAVFIALLFSWLFNIQTIGLPGGG